MSVQLEIVPVSSTLNMYGEPDTSSAYSLSGHISMTLRPPFTFVGSRKSTTVQLQSLELTFEGQSEVVVPSIGYSAVRVCSISQELAPSQGLELTIDEAAGQWNILFSLNIPGWLPESSQPGADITTTSYALYATAKFINLDSQRQSWFSVICSPFRSTRWSVETRHAIIVQRYVEPSTSEPATAPLSHYTINYKTPDLEDTIPREVMSKLRISASVPSIIDINDRKIPITLRLRTSGLPEVECNRLRATGFTVDVVQLDYCMNRPSQQYRTCFPIPDESLQPPEVPLRNHDQFTGTLFDSIPSVASRDICIERSISLLPSYEPGVFALDSENQVFCPDEASWFTLDIDVPISHHSKRNGHSDWDWSPKLRPSAHGPLFSVVHDLKVTFNFVYRSDSDRIATQTVTFTVPLHFAKHAPITPLVNHSPVAITTSGPQLPPVLPYADMLPVYSQLFYSNGERKPDPTPLPLYSLHGPESPSMPHAKDYPVDPCHDSSESTSLLPT